MVQERVRMGLMSASRARNHPERSALTRSIGHELIVSVDLIKLPLEQGDRVIICSDGLHGVLEDRELEQTIRGLNADEAAKRLVDTANQRGTADNLTVCVFTMNGETNNVTTPPSLWQRMTGLFRRQ